jgi:hypothetical protein
MTLSDYYEILGISADSSLEEIKKAYRKKAYLYHPDINHSPQAKDLFISATEAYEFLLSNFGKIEDDEAAYLKAMENWRRYRQERSNQRARAYARASYNKFRESKIYRTTRIFDATRIIYSLVISVVVLGYTIFGYFYGQSHPVPGIKKPTVFGLIMLLLLGTCFLAVSVIYLWAFYQTRKRHNRRT